MAASNYLLGGVICAFIGTALAVTATSTKYWTFVDASVPGISVTEQIGLWESCTQSPILNGCETNVAGDDDGVVCGDHTVRQGKQFFRAMQALSILSAVLAFFALLSGAVRMILKDKFTVPLLVEAGLSLAGSLCSLITWSVWTYFMLSWIGCGESFCSFSESQLPPGVDWQCGFHYSYALSIACSAILVGGSTLFFIGHSQSRNTRMYVAFEDNAVMR